MGQEAEIMIYLELILSFLKIGLFSVGGGYAAMPLIEAQVVKLHGWLTMNEFIDLVTIAEMTPGPIAVNAATFVGNRIAGFGGAVCATAGCILPSLFIVSLLSVIYKKYRNLSVLQRILGTLRPAVVALIASAGLGILLKVLFPQGFSGISSLNLTGGILFLISFCLLRKRKCSPILSMVLCGAAGLLIGILL